MISDIRSYIKSVVVDVDSFLIENTTNFYDDDIGETIINRSYHLEIGAITNTFRTDYREDTLDATLSIFGTGYRDEIANYDELYEKALCIRDRLLNIDEFYNQGTIVSIDSPTITPTRLSGDEQAYKIDIALEIRTAYRRES